MTILRVERSKRFTHIPNAAIEDKRLSFRARGVLAYLLSKPDHWSTNSEHLVDVGVEGRDAIRTCLRELENHGYLSRRRFQNSQGQWVTETLIRDTPTTGSQASAPEPGNPAAGSPGVEVVTTDQQPLTTTLSSVPLLRSVPSDVPPRATRRREIPPSTQGDTRSLDHLFDPDKAEVIPAGSKPRRVISARRPRPTNPNSVDGLRDYWIEKMTAAGKFGNVAHGDNLTEVRATLYAMVDRGAGYDVVRKMIDQYIAHHIPATPRAPYIRSFKAKAHLLQADATSRVLQSSERAEDYVGVVDDGKIYSAEDYA